jgi:hypothetical protein
MPFLLFTEPLPKLKVVPSPRLSAVSHDDSTPRGGAPRSALATRLVLGVRASSETPSFAGTMPPLPALHRPSPPPKVSQEDEPHHCDVIGRNRVQIGAPWLENRSSQWAPMAYGLILYVVGVNREKKSPRLSDLDGTVNIRMKDSPLFH